jgi:hypothetical protein
MMEVERKARGLFDQDEQAVRLFFSVTADGKRWTGGS